MILTDQHISDVNLTELIKDWEHGLGNDSTDHLVLIALLELKQRRAEDRQRGTIDWTKNTVHHLQMDE